MDWYYPVLSGAICGADARRHLAERRHEFVMDGRGVRCVSDKDWATAAETSECAIAYQLAGEHQIAMDLLATTTPMRRDDGRYLTGIVYPDLVTFPDNECSTYTAAAVVLASDALSGSSPASGIFVDHSTLPDIIDIEPLVHEADQSV